ncbi:ATP-dependent protease ATPase subunit HslU [Aminicella lysinilytica]|uniref:ATP-dependent protease ATPase subunit HslU n=1 Tax=Aminicella lysinilytica TaxID=433323 RepID=A0A4R6Q630_9FIRM|nr:ATP-dependent protease ATPase subunit HslU [Aminicella lysinilytica]TDP57485.1 ATP-dependent HslUV protease ATP-binding subunit HslU [Aminicella lysinilytica]
METAIQSIAPKETKVQSMTPKEIVAELDKYIIGQDEAKKSVAIALRNRYRRSLLPEEMREEITPKNILMMGPTGCGKTEIARRLAKLMKAPFVKVEATKFTEVGYVGRDVDSMIRDLAEASIRITKSAKLEEKYDIADKIAEEKIIEAIIPGNKKKEAGQKPSNPFDFIMNSGGYQSQKQQYEEGQDKKNEEAKPASDIEMAREQVKQQLEQGLLEEQFIEIEVADAPKGNQLDMSNEGMSIAIGNIFGDMMPQKTKKKRVRVKDARKILREQEAQNLLDMDQVADEALENAEQNGIIFIDEIDKIASSGGYSGADVSREGVQRDILPIVEGSVVNTKYGPMKTDHILFIGAGAFHTSKPTDLIPELQGRFPIRVELNNLDKEDFVKILTVPENAITKQQQALLATEGINLEFTDDSIDEIAEMSFLMNEQTENIGARRLYTILEKLLEDISFEIPETGDDGKISIDREFVQSKFEDTIRRDDMDKYIL